MIGRDRPPEALGAYTGFLMNWVAQRPRARFFEAMATLGLHPRDFAILTMISERPGVAQQELVAATGTDSSTMVGALDGLERAGLAERRVHSQDRRKRAVHLTEAGWSTLRRAQGFAEEIGEEAFRTLTDDERVELHRLLRKLARLDES